MRHSAFQMAAGGVLGRDHRVTSKNYQDAYQVVQTEDYTLAIVADGCGSGKHSEIGANIGVRFLVQTIAAEIEQHPGREVDWARVQRNVLARLNILTFDMGGAFRATVEEYFLFTLIGVLLRGDKATFFALGDGVVIINDEQLELGPFENNAPPYLGYGLIPGEVTIDPDSIRLLPIYEIRLSELDHFLIGSDGVSDLLQAATKNQPGSEAIYGDISQFWTDDRYFGDNPELVSRRLRLAARDWPKHKPDPGLLPDDTTLVIGRSPLLEEDEHDDRRT